MDSLGALLRLNGLTTATEKPPLPTIVVVVDDHPVSRTLLARLLRDFDDTIEVEEFADPASALAWLPGKHTALIVTDYRMPQMDGVAFIRALRELPTTKRTPIMLVTVLDDKQVKKRALEAGATDFLNKPVDHDECRARCRNLLELSADRKELLEQLSVLKAYIRNLRESAGYGNEVNDVVDVTEGGRYVLMEYRALYEVTSTLSAVDKLLESWRSKRTGLESALKRPLQGDSAKKK
jgi:CheY-like chemotaxis protein